MMSPGFRYHVITVFAIFLALGIGMLAGSSYDKGPLVESLTRRVVNLNTKFDNEIGPLRQENDELKSFLRTIAPEIASGRLKGVRVAILTTGDFPDASRRLLEMVQMTGAQVVSQTRLSVDFLDRLPGRLAEISLKLQTTHPGMAVEKNAALRVLAGVLAGTGQEVDLRPFEEAGLLERSGDYAIAAESVLILGGAANQKSAQADALEVPLIEELKRLGARVFYCEPSASAVSESASVRQTGVPFVEKVDSETGEIRLLLAVTAPRNP